MGRKLERPFSLTTMTNTPHIYLWHGEDSFSMHKELVRWKETFSQKYTGLNVQTIDPDEDIPQVELITILHNLFSVDSLFGAIKLIIIKNLLSDHKKNIRMITEMLTPLLQTLTDSTFLIFFQTEPIKNHALFETLKALAKEKKVMLKEFFPPSLEKLPQWISEYGKANGVEIHTKVCLELARGSHPLLFETKKEGELNLWQLTNELNKLISFVYPKKVITEAHVQDLLSYEKEFEIWKLISAILTSDKEVALLLLEKRISGKAKSLQANEMRLILSLLSRQIRKLLLIKRAHEPNIQKLSHTLGWPRNQTYAVLKQAEKTSAEELIRWQHFLPFLYEKSFEDFTTFKVSFTKAITSSEKPY